MCLVLCSDFIFLIKDLVNLRDESNVSLEEAGAVAKRILSHSHWSKEGGAGGGSRRVQKIRPEEFIKVSKYECQVLSIRCSHYLYFLIINQLIAGTAGWCV